MTRHGHPFPHGVGADYRPPVIPSQAPHRQFPGMGWPSSVQGGSRPISSFADRALARLIDWFVLAVAVAIVLATSGYFVGLRVAQSIDIAEDGTIPQSEVGALAILALLAIASFVLCMAVHFIYEVELTWRTGQTFGKRLMKLQVMSREPAVPVGRMIMAKRWLIMGPVSVVVPLVGLVDGLWQLGDERYRQCLHDKFAGTIVVTK